MKEFDYVIKLQKTCVFHKVLLSDFDDIRFVKK